MMNNQELAEVFKTSVYNTVHFSAATTKAIGDTSNGKMYYNTFIKKFLEHPVSIAI